MRAVVHVKNKSPLRDTSDAMSIRADATLDPSQRLRRYGASLQTQLADHSGFGYVHGAAKGCRQHLHGGCIQHCWTSAHLIQYCEDIRIVKLQDVGLNVDSVGSTPSPLASIAQLVRA